MPNKSAAERGSGTAVAIEKTESCPELAGGESPVAGGANIRDLKVDAVAVAKIG